MNPCYFWENDMAIGFHEKSTKRSLLQSVHSISQYRLHAYHTLRTLTQRASVTSGVHRLRAGNSTSNNGATHLASHWSPSRSLCTRPSSVKARLFSKARSTLATMSKQRSTLLPKTATMSNEICIEISSFRQSRTLLRHCCKCGPGLRL